MNTNKLSRRTFLTTLAASGLALKWGKQCQGKALASYNFCEAEGARLTRLCMSHFWDPNSRMFRAPVLSSETVPSDATHDRGYTFWASLLALHALIEGERAHSGQYADRIATVYEGLEQYYSPDLHAYTSWVRFPGNNDAYYDDNSWAVITLVEASLACQKAAPQQAAQYLERAKTVMADFVVKGYDTSGQPGGMRWGIDASKANTSDRGTSSTAGSALAALMLVRAGVDMEFYTKWGHDLAQWISTRLMDTDGLIMDALVEPDWTPRRVKWTYNTGVPMRAYVEHYRLTKDQQSLEMSTRLAQAALNTEGGLFDQKVRDASKRSFWDGTYFVHYLVDGLLQVASVTPDKKFAATINNAVIGAASYAYNQLRDPSDGLYWRNWRLYTIGEAQHRRWQQWTGQTIQPEYDASERSQEAKFQNLPVQERPLVKTLLANAGVARMFWLVAPVLDAPRKTN